MSAADWWLAFITGLCCGYALRHVTHAIVAGHRERKRIDAEKVGEKIARGVR